MVLTPVFYIFLNKKIRRAIFGKLFDPTSDVAAISRSKNYFSLYSEVVKYKY